MFDRPPKAPVDISQRVNFSHCHLSNWQVNQRGMTLIELLVVLAIIGVLMAITIPAVRAARESANRTTCANNIRQLGVALDHHHQQLGSYPQDGERGWGMSVFLFPFLEEKSLYDKLNPKKVDLPDPTKAREGFEDTILEILRCPSAGSQSRLPESSFARSNYLGTTDLFAERKVYEDIRDGESKTIAIGETVIDHAWALPRTGSSEMPPNGGGDFGSQHRGGTQFVMCDTSVKFINDDVDPVVFKALCTIDGREATNEF